MKSVKLETSPDFTCDFLILHLISFLRYRGEEVSPFKLKADNGDAKTQRQFDSNQSKEFTRCVVGKSKSKTAVFEYTDIDTETVITPEEYEKR